MSRNKIQKSTRYKFHNQKHCSLMNTLTAVNNNGFSWYDPVRVNALLLSSTESFNVFQLIILLLQVKLYCFCLIDLINVISRRRRQQFSVEELWLTDFMLPAQHRTADKVRKNKYLSVLTESHSLVVTGIKKDTLGRCSFNKKQDSICGHLCYFLRVCGKA